MRIFSALIVLTVALSGTTSAGADDVPVIPHAVRSTLDVTQTGLSGLAVDGEGVLWVVPERTRVLIPLKRDGGKLVPTGEPVPLEWVPQSHDTEAMAFLPDGRLALGTETRTPRKGDEILIARRDDDAFRVEDKITLPYSHWNLDAHPNKGIEGLCVASGHLVAGLERSIEKGRIRHAPLAVYDLEKEEWTPYTLKLTSNRGKLGAVTCRPGKDGIEVRAIERHFGTSHLLAIHIPLPPKGGELEPKIVGSLIPAGSPSENYESIAWLSDGGLAIVADNHYGRVTGPSAVVLLPETISAPAK